MEAGRSTVRVALGLLGLLACNGQLGFPVPRVATLATPDSGAESPTVVIPDTARSWVPFEVEILTYQNRYCEGSAGANVDTDGLRATVTPLIRTTGGPSCPDAAAIRPIRARVVFTRAGMGSVTVRAIPYGGNAPTDIEYGVVVR